MNFDLGRINNYSAGKDIRKMTSADTIYIKKMVNNFDYTFFCKFIKFEKGVVYGEIIDMSPDWAKSSWLHENGAIMKARPTKCYLWGKSKTAQWDHCNWFNSKGICP
jgi:hypothetical protein